MTVERRPLLYSFLIQGDAIRLKRVNLKQGDQHISGFLLLSHRDTHLVCGSKAVLIYIPVSLTLVIGQMPTWNPE